MQVLTTGVARPETGEREVRVLGPREGTSQGHGHRRWAPRSKLAVGDPARRSGRSAFPAHARAGLASRAWTRWGSRGLLATGCNAPRRRLVPGSKVSRVRQQRLDQRRRPVGAQRIGGEGAAATQVLAKRPGAKNEAEVPLGQQHDGRGRSTGRAQEEGSAPEAPGELGTDSVLPARPEVEEPA